MSVKGNYPTKQGESQYNTLIYNLIYLLQYRLRKFYTQEPCNETAFRHTLLKTYKKSTKMEQDKFIPPKFSEAVKDFAQLMFAMD